MSARLSREFFDRHHVDVARALIGLKLCWDSVAGIIVETEAYAAVDDPACHTWSRPSARQFFTDNQSGTAYVYLSYGVHWMLNVLAADGIVLFRALQPTAAIPAIRRRRSVQPLTQLCSGPGKLGQALGLSAEDHGASLLTSRRCVRTTDAAVDSFQVLADRRVGISQAVERPWRFLLADNPHVSVPHGRTASRQPRRATKGRSR
jgi:DNA-3-methyladenine glycosylase